MLNLILLSKIVLYKFIIINFEVMKLYFVFSDLNYRKAEKKLNIWEQNNES